MAAVGSYLDAKHQHGTWLIRIEDLDTPRCSSSAADHILRTLAAYQLHSDETVIYQSQRSAAYEQALQQLTEHIYPCCCTRKEIADSAQHGIDGAIYPDTCRNGLPLGREGRAIRVKTHDQAIQFHDVLQGKLTQQLHSELGDFVIKRADGLFAYQLAVVLDDAYQNISHVVRGIDLLHSTPRQIYLQQLLNMPVPEYLHLPIAVNAQGEKLSKQTLAPPITSNNISATLYKVLDFLKQAPPVELLHASAEEILNWGILHWQRETLKNCQQQTIN